MTKRIGRNDVIFLLLLLVVILVVVLGNKNRHQEQGARVLIEVDGSIYGEYPLMEDASIPIEQEQGGVTRVTNYVEISHGKATMSEASCPDLLCVHQKDISKEGEMIVCLPNKVVVYIAGETTPDYDGISQ